MTQLTFTLLFNLANLTEAAPICPPTISQIAGNRAVTKFFFRTATIGQADRRDLKNFAKDLGESEATVARRYSGSVDIYCDDRFAQAQVVVKNDLLLIPAHLLYLNNDCDTPADIAGCRIFHQEGGKFIRYEVSKKEASGYACPDKSSTTDRNDWAIIRLKQPLPSSVKPYKVSVAPCAKEYEPADAILVAKSGDWRPEPSKTMAEAPRHYGRCQIMRGNCPDRVQAMETDCDMDTGASGGGLFTGGKQPQLVGINAAIYKGCPDSKEDQTGRYNHFCWSSAVAPVTEDLVAKLASIVKQ